LVAVAVVLLSEGGLAAAADAYMQQLGPPPANATEAVMARAEEARKRAMRNLRMRSNPWNGDRYPAAAPQA